MNKELEQNRLETGIIELEGDWPGVFIRGDNAMHYKQGLDILFKHILNNIPEEELNQYTFVINSLKGLKELLSYSMVHEGQEKQELKSYKECKK